MAQTVRLATSLDRILMWLDFNVARRSASEFPGLDVGIEDAAVATSAANTYSHLRSIVWEISVWTIGSRSRQALNDSQEIQILASSATKVVV